MVVEKTKKNTGKVDVASGKFGFIYVSAYYILLFGLALSVRVF